MWHLRHKPEVTSGLLTIFLRAVETTIRQRSPGAPPGARFGAVAFVHRFGSYLNSHVHFHVLVTDGVFSAGDDGEAVFHPALDLEPGDFEAVQAKMRHRGLRWLHRHGHLDDDALHVLDSSEHAGGWSVDASVTIPGWNRHGLERLARYCARPPLSQDRLGRLNEQTLVYSLRRPDRRRPHRTAADPDRIAGSSGPTGDPAPAAQAPLLRRAGTERSVARGGDRVGRSGGSDASASGAGAREHGVAIGLAA
ncbi:MAG: transposase [bacterium]|nr:transposase [bacterium]